jgi:hypothetical protein
MWTEGRQILLMGWQTWEKADKNLVARHPAQAIQPSLEKPYVDLPVLKAVFWIRDILVRIRIRGTVPLIILIFSFVTFKKPTNDEGTFSSFFIDKKS